MQTVLRKERRFPVESGGAFSFDKHLIQFSLKCSYNG